MMTMWAAKATGVSGLPTVQSSVGLLLLLQQPHQPAKMTPPDVPAGATTPGSATGETSAGGIATRLVGDANGAQF